MNEEVLTSGDEALEQLRRLESITDVALAHIDLDSMLPELLLRVRDLLDVDTVAVLLLDEGTNELVARAAKGIEEEVERGTRIPLGRGFAGAVAAERRPIAIFDLDRAEIVNPILHEKRIRSLLGVPLIVAGRVTGVLHVGSLTPREFRDDEATLLERAAGRIAPAIDHARLYDAERASRRRAESAVNELQALQGVADAALAHLELEPMLEEILERLRGSLRADTAAILLLDTESHELVARAARGLEEEVEQGIRIPVGRGFAGRIAATREVVEIPDLSQADVVNPILGQKGIVSLLGAPLIAGGDIRGVVHVGTLTARDFDDADHRLLQLAADRIAMALDHSRLMRERDIALSLQQSLLPERLSDVPGLTLAARYHPGRGNTVGGDWYDVIPLPNGGVGLAIGDVVSRGVRAAGVMGQLRHALRTRAIEGDEPAQMLERLAQTVRRMERREMVTVAYVEVDASSRRVRYVSAGHPPPLVVVSGKPRLLEEVRGAPLGALAHPRYEHATTMLAPDSLIVMYTDGLVERRDRPIEAGMELLEAIAVRSGPAPEQVCEALSEELIDEHTEDDVALLIARTVPESSETLELQLPAIVSSLAAVRSALRQWLADNDASEYDVIDILIAVGEAVGNAVEHAYGPGDAVFEVSGTISGRDLEICVRDYGTWRAPRGQNRGRGTQLMQDLMDDFEVRTSSEGTEVLMRRRLGQGPPSE